VSHLTAGILLATLSVTANATGMVLEKLASRRLPSIHARQGLRMITTLARDPLWTAGFVLLIFGLGSQVLALTVAPIDIVQAVAACGVSVFLLLSHFVLRERLSKFEYLGIALILLSLLLLGFSVDPHDDRVTTANSVLSIFSVAIPALIVGLTVFILTDRIKVTSARGAHVKAPLFGISSGLLYGVAALGIKEISTIVTQHGLVDGIPRILESPGFYLFLGSTVLGFLVFQTALQRTTASVFVPVNTVTSSCYFIVAGTLLFHERLPSAMVPLILRLGAFVLILLGLLILAASKSIESAETVHPDVNGGGQPVIVGDMEGVSQSRSGSRPSLEPVNVLMKEFSLAAASSPASKDAVESEQRLASSLFSGLDPLTSTANPLLVYDRLSQAQIRRQRHGGEVLVCRIGVEPTIAKAIGAGQVAASRALSEAFRRLMSMVRLEDTVGRIGKNKLAVILEVKGEQDVEPLIHRLQRGLDEPVMMDGTLVCLQPSLGVAIADSRETPEQVLARADRSSLVGRRLNSVRVE
jgi:GGDEF domain-containing protein/drug/metabolite transporter (DMT)-like permease